MHKRNLFRSVLAMAMSAAMVVSPLSVSAEEAVTATGVGTGIDGDVVVEVVATPDEILSVTVTEQNETVGIGSVAVETLPEEIVQNQTIDVDDIAGATVSSVAIKDAVRAALESAGIDADAFSGAPEASEEEAAPAEDVTLETDVVVVGAGGAGMTAAIVAKDAGKDVLVLESQAMVGGNSVRSTGGLNAGKTPLQDENEFAESAGVEKQLGVAADTYADDEVITALAATVKEQWDAYQANPEGYFDSVELYELDTMIGGKAINDPALVETLCANSADAIAWLESIGAPLPSVSSFGGASVKRIHRPVDGEGKTVSVGSYLIPIFQSNLEERGIEVMLNTTATALLVEDGAVTGVEAVGASGEKVTVLAKSVVLATGGFGANLEKVAALNPELEGFMTTNAPGILGQGIEMAEAIGAATVDMDQIQIHPTVQADTAALITEGLRGDGAILVNEEGLRFIDEVGTRDVVSAAEIAQTGSHSYLIVDQAMVDASSVIAGYITKGYTVSGDTYEALAEALGMDATAFADTMEKWNSYVANKEDPDFGRTSFANPLDSAPFYAINVTAGIHHTMGGLKIDTETHVLNADGEAIPNLFAAGEVTGGVHGGNRLGGNAVADFVVFGRIAGESAVANIQ